WRDELPSQDKFILTAALRLARLVRHDPHFHRYRRPARAVIPAQAGIQSQPWRDELPSQDKFILTAALRLARLVRHDPHFHRYRRPARAVIPAQAGIQGDLV
ncbi:MAG TPA: hypothetical protein VFE24_10405, partial [Pirellulales bacterium]|nr:hypothetical protein [Pirellulales bacterium]